MKPTAWMMVNRENTSSYLTFDTPTRDMKISHEPIPLYQVKELMDEETWDVIDNCFGIDAFNFDYQITLGEARANAFELVKAILRKTQEK